MTRQKHSLLSKKIVLIIFLFLPLFASFVSLIFNANVFQSVFLFLIIPSIFLSFVQKKSIIKSLIFSMMSIPVLLIIDYISHKTGQWIVPVTTFSFRFFNTVPVEDSFWAFFWTYEIVMFYEYFLDLQRKKEFYKKSLLPLLLISFLVPTVWFLVGFQYKAFFQIKYFYVIWGTVILLIPLFLFLLKYPRLIKKFILVGLYFIYLNFTYEITALIKNWWFFPKTSEFLGWVSIGNLSFPIEEFIFYIIIYALGLLAWYEFFDDDRK